MLTDSASSSQSGVEGKNRATIPMTDAATMMSTSKRARGASAISSGVVGKDDRVRATVNQVLAPAVIATKRSG